MYLLSFAFTERMLLLVLFLTFSALVVNPKKLLFTVANPARGQSAEQGIKEKVWQRPPPTPYAARSEIKKKNHSSHLHACMPRRYGGVGPSRVRTRIPSTRRLGQWVSLRKILRFRVRKQSLQSRCLSLLLATSSRVYLFFPPRGHEPPSTLRDRLSPHLSL